MYFELDYLKREWKILKTTETIPMPTSALPPLLYLWKEKKKNYENRKSQRKWGETFENNASSRSSRERRMFQYEDKRRSRIAESGWKNTIVILPDMQEKTDDAVHLEIDNKGSTKRNRGNYCFVCWEIVYSGNNRICCSHCMAIIHSKCIDILTEAENDVDLHQLAVHQVSNSKHKKDEEWTCSDCIEEKSDVQDVRSHQQYRESMLIFAVVKIQSFSRMVRYRLDYIFAKIGFTRLQHLFHSKKAWMELKTYEEKRPRPIRIRIHDVRLFMRSPESLDDDTLDPKILPNPVSKKIGEVGCGMYDSNFRCGKQQECR